MDASAAPWPYGAFVQYPFVPFAWPECLAMLSLEEQRAWRATWAEDLPDLRQSYPELAAWDDLQLVEAVHEFFQVVYAASWLGPQRNPLLLGWLYLGQQAGTPPQLQAVSPTLTAATDDLFRRYAWGHHPDTPGAP